LQYHPDKYVNESSKQEIATRNFQKLNAAYEVIKKYKNFK
jgi:DnaJ-class molecular chaperone